MKVTRRWLVLPAAAALIAIAAFDAWLGTCGFEGCPSRAEILAYRPDEGGKILDRAGRVIGRLAFVRRINVSIAQVPSHVRAAFVATEDRRFYDHSGLDWRALGRSIAHNASALGVREGFSTITMQVAHNTFLDGRYEGRSLKRKLLELRIARLLEQSLSKNQILELYLNAIYLGDGVYGVEAASRDLFGKHVSELSVAEGAMLAALPKGPSAYTPRHDEDRALKRRNLVLSLMGQQGYLSSSAVEDAIDEPLELADSSWRPEQHDASSAIDAVRGAVDSAMLGATRPTNMVVRTTIDWPLQRTADRVVDQHAEAIEQETQASYGEASASAQGAFIAIDAATGDIRALVGGRAANHGGFNRALSAHRQPGSAFKPFVYAAALAAGLSPASIVDDSPVEVNVGGRIWTPANYTPDYLGPVTLRRALMVSSNAAAVRVSRAVGELNVITAARRNGISSRLTPVPSIALGALEVTPIELVSAYAPFANGGRRVTPRLVTQIEAPNGKVLWKNPVRPTRAAMDPRDAYEITSMLRGVVDYGTGRAVRAMGVTGPVAGKTGTTNNGADVWFVGYTPTLVAGVWFGYDTPRSISTNAGGGRLAAPAWGEIMHAAWHEPKGSKWVPPAVMDSATIDPESGQLAGRWCPRRQREWFKPGTVPTEPCAEHHAPPIAAISASANDLLHVLVRGIKGLIIHY